MKFDIHLKLVKLVFYTSSNYISSNYTGTVFTVSFLYTILMVLNFNLRCRSSRF
jgi:hypothetical protein